MRQEAYMEFESYEKPGWLAILTGILGLVFLAQLLDIAVKDIFLKDMTTLLFFMIWSVFTLVMVTTAFVLSWHRVARKLEQTHIVLENLLTSDAMDHALRMRADRAFHAFDKESESERDKTCTDTQLAAAKRTAKSEKKAFWELHGALSSLGIELQSRIVDYASKET